METIVLCALIGWLIYMIWNRAAAVEFFLGYANRFPSSKPIPKQRMERICVAVCVVGILLSLLALFGIIPMASGPRLIEVTP